MAKKNKVKKSKQKKNKEIVKPKKKKNSKGKKTQQKRSKKKKGRKNNEVLHFSAKKVGKRGKRQFKSDDDGFSNKKKRRKNRRQRWDNGIESDEDKYDSGNDSIDSGYSDGFDEFDEFGEFDDSKDIGEDVEKTQHEKNVDFIQDVSNLVTGSIAAYLCSLGISLFSKFKNDCSFLFMLPAAAYTTIFGFCMCLASLAGMLGRRTGHGLALCLHTFGRPLFVMLVLCFCLFGYLVATKGQGKQLEGMNVKEYKLEDYSKFLAWVARNGTQWDKTKKCLEKAEICAGLFATDVKGFYNLKLTPLQSGCCKPPFACGYAYDKWGLFTNPTNDKADADCDLWGHGFATRYLCFDCNSCRAGMAETIKATLLKMTITNLGLSCGFVFMLLVEYYLIRRERKKMEVEMEEAAHNELEEEEEEEEWNAMMWKGNEELEDEDEDATSYSNYQQTQPGYYQQGQYGYPYGY